MSQGYGQSSPIVWKDRVFITTMDGEKKETSRVLCYQLESGKELWRRELKTSQPIESSNFVSRSAPTPCCDATNVYAFFEGGELVALKHDGTELWQRSLVKDYGKFEGNHGVGSSLAIDANAIYALVNHGGPSYLTACDKTTGKEIWKRDYDARVSWSSPVIGNFENKSHVIVSAAGRVDVYEAATGATVWTADGYKGNTVPSATVSNDRILIGSSDRASNVALNFGKGRTS